MGARLQMFKIFHDFFHIVDDHNELRQGEAAMADAWGTRDWAERHFAEGLGLWEVNVFKAAVHFQHVTYHHSEFRKRLALAFLTLGKHDWGTPLTLPSEPASTSSSELCHPCKTFTQLTGKAREGHTCGYCGTESAYLCCTACFPDPTTAYGICNPSTGRDCFARHVLGLPATHGTHRKQKREPAGGSRRAREHAEQREDARKAQCREAAREGGLRTQQARRARGE